MEGRRYLEERFRKEFGAKHTNRFAHMGVEEEYFEKSLIFKAKKTWEKCARKKNGVGEVVVFFHLRHRRRT